MGVTHSKLLSASVMFGYVFGVGVTEANHILLDRLVPREKGLGSSPIRLLFHGESLHNLPARKAVGPTERQSSPSEVQYVGPKKFPRRRLKTRKQKKCKEGWSGLNCNRKLPPKGSLRCKKMRKRLKRLKYPNMCVFGTGCPEDQELSSEGAFESACDLRSSNSDTSEEEPPLNWDMLEGEGIADLSSTWSSLRFSGFDTLDHEVGSAQKRRVPWFGGF